MKQVGRPKGAKDGAGAAQPRRFLVSFDLSAGASAYWLVSTGEGRGTRWFRGKEINILVPVLGAAKRDAVPRCLFLAGEGVVSQHGDTVVITA